MLEGRAVGETAFVELFAGMMLSHVVFNLHPEYAYNFRLKAINAVGESEYSDIYSLQTPAKYRAPIRNGDWREDLIGNADILNIEENTDDGGVLSESSYANAQRCADAWRSHYDHQTGQMFYFNVLTGSRQLLVPAAIQQRRRLAGHSRIQAGPDDTVHVPGDLKDDREILMAENAAFRLKRFRFMRDLRRQRQETCSSPVQLPTMASMGTRDDAVTHADEEEENRLAAELHDLAPMTQAASSSSTLFRIDVERSTMLVDTFRIMSTYRTGGVGGELRKRLRVTFKGEAGIDAGGLTKEFYLLLSKQMLRYSSERYRKLMRPTASGRFFFSEVTPQLLSAHVLPPESDNDGPDTVPEGSVAGLAKVSATSFVHFMGRMIGKAMYDQQMIDAPLCGALLAHMTRPSTGKVDSVGFGDDFLSEDDMKDLDPHLYQSLAWVKNNNITDTLDNTFTVVGPNGNEIILCKDGDKMKVTEENKAK